MTGKRSSKASGGNAHSPERRQERRLEGKTRVPMNRTRVESRASAPGSTGATCADASDVTPHNSPPSPMEVEGKVDLHDRGSFPHASVEYLSDRGQVEGLAGDARGNQEEGNTQLIQALLADSSVMRLQVASLQRQLEETRKRLTVVHTEWKRYRPLIDRLMERSSAFHKRTQRGSCASSGKTEKKGKNAE